MADRVPPIARVELARSTGRLLLLPLLLAVVAWYAFVLLSTRRPDRPREPGPLGADGRARFEEDVEAALSADGIIERATPRTLWIGLRLAVPR